MSDPQRRQVRVRRSPKIGVFLLIGAVVGALVAVIAVNLTPADDTVPKVQAIGVLLVLLAPVGAAISGVIALVLDRIAERRAKVVEAERSGPSAAVVEPEPEPAAAAEPVDGDADRSAPTQNDPLG